LHWDCQHVLHTKLTSDIMEEIWKDIEGYEGLYQVSNMGRVRSLDRKVATAYSAIRTFKGKILAPWTDRYGYLHVNLWSERKMKSKTVHRLVAGAFISNPDNMPEVNHKDEDKQNNRADNLEWCDTRYNINYGNRSHKVSQTRISNAILGLRVEQLTMDGQHVRTFDSIREASRVSGADKSVIVRVCKGRLQSAGGYRWRYAE